MAYYGTYLWAWRAQLQPDQSHSGLGATPMPQITHNRIIVVCQPFKLILRLPEATITMPGLETTRKSPAVDKEIPSFDSGHAGDLYPFKCLVRSAVRRARIDIKHRTCYLLLYMFSPGFVKSVWFSRCFPHLLLPCFFGHLPRYKLVQMGSLHFPILGKLITRLSGYALFCLQTGRHRICIKFSRA